MTQTEKQWTEYAVKHLVGRKIVAARYLTAKEADGIGWSQRSIVLVLDNGMTIYPSSDDEGNEAGALFGNYRETEMTFPVI